MQNKVLAKAILCSVLLGNTLTAYAATADDYRSNSEYQAIGTNVLDTIHAAEAYAKGYTGAGITVGVTDDPINYSNGEFSTKSDSSSLDGSTSSNWKEDMHGTHVAGIAVADKNGVGMHGVAYDANVKGVNSDGSGDIFSYYYAYPEIKVINNSWGSTSYVHNVNDEKSFDYAHSQATVFKNYSNAKTAAANDKLLIFAGGNAGHSMPGPENLFPFWEMYETVNNISSSSSGSLAKNMISVSSITTYEKDSSGNTVAPLTYDSSTDSFTATAAAISIFSDLTQFAEDWSVAAPGCRIISANSNYAADGQLDEESSGTSMAAPVVTGVAALVQQAYPYLNAKQIGDVVLSTANNNITAAEGYYVTMQQDDAGNNGTSISFNVYYTGSSADKTALATLNEYFSDHPDMKSYIIKGMAYTLMYSGGGESSSVSTEETKATANATRAIDDPPAEYITKATEILEAYLAGNTTNLITGVNAYYNTPVDALFGQGIVDASKAVYGLGAINVRRLTSSDISDKYTVNGTTEKQALYSVDTQGYNSVWSNDISEIRVGKIAEQPLDGFRTDDTDYSDVQDLYKRYVYYQQFTAMSYFVEQYIDTYNKYYENEGLIGLHGGLYKTGDGVLVLAGKNTYQGSSIAAGGTLQIDGSVAGDAYSEGEGTIAGIGEIKGNLYNNGTVMAGQALSGYANDQTGTTLTVDGDFSGTGTIALNIVDAAAGLISVGGTADLSNMTLEAAVAALPNQTATFVEATTIEGVENGTLELSGLLNAEVSLTKADGKQQASLSTVAANHTGVQDATFAAVNSLYASTEDEELGTLYALDKADATTALNQLTGGLAEDMAHDAIQNRDVRTALREQQHLQRTDGLWLLLDKHWQRYDDTDAHGFTATIGKDFFNNDSAYAGALFAYSTNTLSDTYDSGDYDNYTLGIYGGTKNAAGTWRGYISYGLQDNSVNRNLTALGRTARADYDSSTLGVGVRYAYDLQYGNEAKTNHWHSVPYAQLNYTHYKQDGYTEKGAGIYERQVAGYSDDYADGELGLEIKRTDAYGSYGFSLGYRRILTGEQQESTAFFTGDGTRTSFTSAGTAEEKDHVVLGAFIGTKFSDKWSAAGQLQQDWSSNSNELHVNVVFNYSF